MKKLFLSLFILLGAISAKAADSDVVTIVSGDFTVFTEGSESAPSKTDISGSTSTSKFYSTTNGWKSSKIFEAGGCVLVGDGGNITSPYLTGSSTYTAVKVTAVVKATQPIGGFVNMSIGYTTNTTLTLGNDQWTTLTWIAKGSNYANLKIEPFMLADGLLVKSVKVEASNSFYPAPTVYLPSDFDGTSFTARWATISGAKEYYIDVFTIAADGTRTYALQNVKANTTSVSTTYKVTGLDAAKQYYYCMRASNGTATSDDSEVVKLVRKLTHIDVPVQLPHSNVTATAFTANWQAVDNATHYVANLYSHYTLTEETMVNILSEDFSGVKVGTFEQVELDGNLNEYTAELGWDTEFSSKAFAAGYFVLAPYSGDGHLWTPTMNLSANGGKFTAKIDAAEANWGTFYAAGKFTVTLVDTSGDNVIEEGDTIAITDKAFKTFDFNFTKGTTESRLLITYIQNTDNKYKFYIDSINVAQLQPAGAVVEKLLESVEVDGLSHEFSYTPAANTRFSTTVQAVGLTVSGTGSTASEAEIYSKESAHVYVDQTTAINTVNGDANAAEVIATEYYDMLGRRMTAEPQNGMYIRRETLSNGTVRATKHIR